MTRDNPRELIAELRERAERPSTGSNTAQCMREAADALAVLSAPQEAKVGCLVNHPGGVCPGYPHAAPQEGDAQIDAILERLNEANHDGDLRYDLYCELHGMVSSLPALSRSEEGDARERLHAKCDCVPDLGPAHCHLCGNELGSPVPWLECSAVRTAAPEPEWEYAWLADEDARQSMRPRGPRIMMDEHPFTPEEAARFPRGQRVRRRKAGPWEPLPVGGDNE